MQHLFDRDQSLGRLFRLAARVFPSHHRLKRRGRHDAKLADVFGGPNDFGALFAVVFRREKEAKEGVGERGSDYGEIGLSSASLYRDFDSIAAP